jgi:hypothetical protein
MGLAIKIPGTLPAANYPKIESFYRLPAAKLVECWAASRGITKDEAGKVSAWVGQKGAVVAQADAALRPGYAADAANGMPGVVFTGGIGYGQRLLSPDVTIPAEAYLVVGIVNIDPPGQNQPYEALFGYENPYGGTTRAWLCRAPGQTANAYGAVLRAVTAIGVAKTPAVYAYGSVDVVGVYFNAAGEWRIRVNGAVGISGSGNGVQPAVQGVAIGHYNAESAAQVYWSAVPTAFAAIYQGPLTDAELAAIDAAGAVLLGK